MSLLGRKISVFLVCVAGVSGLIACSSAPPATRATIQQRRERDADAAFRLGRYGSATQRYERAVVLARARDDQPAVARLLLRQATALSAVGLCRLALPALRESAAIRLRLDDAAGVRRVHLGLGRCLAERGDPVAATVALRAAQAGGSGCTRVEALAGLGALAAQARRLSTAAALYSQAATITCTHHGVIALLAYNRGRLAVRRGQSGDAAMRFFKLAGRDFALAQNEAGLADALVAVATLQAERGRFGDAGDTLRRAGHAAWSAQRRTLAASCFLGAAGHFGKAGRAKEAERCRTLGRHALTARWSVRVEHLNGKIHHGLAIKNVAP